MAPDEAGRQLLHHPGQAGLTARGDHLDVGGAVHEEDRILGAVGELRDPDGDSVRAALAAEDRVGVFDRPHGVEEDLDPGAGRVGDRQALCREPGEPGREVELGLAVDLVRERLAVEALGRGEGADAFGQRQDGRPGAGGDRTAGRAGGRAQEVCDRRAEVRLGPEQGAGNGRKAGQGCDGNRRARSRRQVRRTAGDMDGRGIRHGSRSGRSKGWVEVTHNRSPCK